MVELLAGDLHNRHRSRHHRPQMNSQVEDNVTDFVNVMLGRLLHCSNQLWKNKEIKIKFFKKINKKNLKHDFLWSTNKSKIRLCINHLKNFTFPFVPSPFVESVLPLMVDQKYEVTKTDNFPQLFESSSLPNFPQLVVSQMTHWHHFEYLEGLTIVLLHFLTLVPLSHLHSQR